MDSPRTSSGRHTGRPLHSFHPIIARWFRDSIGTPTDVQTASWPALCSGEHALIAAPTGSGKTLAAFLVSIDSLFQQALSNDLTDQTQILYVSPLKALSNDVQKNLRRPLGEISANALAAGLLLPEIRVEVRTGDTPTKARQDMLRRPPHILITTPESLFLLLTARKSREILRTVRTVIVDEIHALAGNKRGAHVALSLERLDAVTRTKPNRIGLSATQRPLEAIAQFLTGGTRHVSETREPVWAPPPCHLVDMGQRREMDLALETPGDELGAIATNAIWTDVYDRLTELVHVHRSTLVFVNTRRLAERIAHHLTERLGEDLVAAHHGSLSRKMRLWAEERLKRGQTRVVIATASLELGIDIGFVDLVCQVGSPRAIATCLQRIGRAGHWVGATPKGRLLCTTRDELVECAALIRAIHRGNLDQISVPQHPKDILAQQLVAEVSAQEWPVDSLYQQYTQAYPYRHLTRKAFDEILAMLTLGWAPNRGRQQALLFHDRPRSQLRARRGARLAALTSGGAIPDTATYAVIAEPQGNTVGSVDEDFAVESLAGDVILLGNTSWRIRGVETGVMRVEDAQGAPPTIPFWRGEAPSRTLELSREVAELRQAVAERLRSTAFPATAGQDALLHWLESECGADQRAAEQILAYHQSGLRMLGAVPTQRTVIAERFFDEAGGMQLVIHAPFGGRINRAWGLALRKRFCVSFDFELQAAATDEGLVLSLGERHSFPLETVWSLLRASNVKEVLTQAVLQSPLFMARWRWNVSRALAVLRFRNGRRVPLHLQRMRAEDLLTSVFPMAMACQDNRPPGNIEVPSHPLVQETLRDCLEDAMDVDGLTTLLEHIEQGNVQCLSVESPAPSPFSHEILNANPYGFLDDAPLEERRSRAVNMRHVLPPEEAATVGALDVDAIASVCREAWPRARDADELQEALQLLTWVPEDRVAEWSGFLQDLLDSGRAIVFSHTDPARDRTVSIWTTPDHLSLLAAIRPDPGPSADARQRKSESSLIFSGTEQEARTAIVRSWMEVIGPTTAEELATTLRWPLSPIQTALEQLEAQGQVLRGTFRPRERRVPSPATGLGEASSLSLPESEATHGAEIEWCDRRLLARIHRRTVHVLRREIQTVSASDFMRFLFRWQHVAPTARLHGELGLQTILEQLAGFEVAASAWEPHVLGSRMANYRPDTLDYLCLRGIISWGRLTPPTLNHELAGVTQKKRIIPTSLAPISLFPRNDAGWLLALARKPLRGKLAWLPEQLTAVAQTVYHYLSQRGASFFADVTRDTHQLQAEVEQGLWELASVGLVTADGFDNLRALLDPKRRRGMGRHQKRRPRHTIGRWSLLTAGTDHPDEQTISTGNPTEAWARQLLRRYGIVFRDLVKRESLAVAWRDLLMIYRRLELRGEIRGGYFVSGMTGEQFALPEAVEALRAVRNDPQVGGQEIRLSGSDPLNLVGIILPGERLPALPSRCVIYRNGIPVASEPLANVSA